MSCRLDEVIGRLRQRIHAQSVQVLDLVSEPARLSEPRNRGRIGDQNPSARYLRELGPQARHHTRSLGLRRRPLLEGLEYHEGHTLIWLFQSIDDVVARDFEDIGDTGCLHRDIAHLRDDLFRSLDAGGLRQLGNGQNVALVFFRDEPGRHRREYQKSKCTQPAECHHHEKPDPGE